MVSATSIAPAWDGFAQTVGVISADQLVEILAPRPANVSRVHLNVLFDANKWAVTPRAKDQLRELGKALASKKMSGANFEVIGHTDASGGAKDNKLLSLKRAESVRRYLIRNFRIAPRRLIASGYGEEKLKDALRPTHRINRRVEIVRIIANRLPEKALKKEKTLSDLLGPDRLEK